MAIAQILLVEPHGSLLELIRQTLVKQPGLQVIGEAGTANQALKLMEDRAPEIVIIDIHLPDMCGLEAIPRVLAKAPQAQVILLTDEDDLRYQRAAESNGVHTCIRKDLIANALVTSVQQLFGKRLDPARAPNYS